MVCNQVLLSIVLCFNCELYCVLNECGCFFNGDNNNRNNGIILNYDQLILILIWLLRILKFEFIINIFWN